MEYMVLPSYFLFTRASEWAELPIWSNRVMIEGFLKEPCNVLYSCTENVRRNLVLYRKNEPKDFDHRKVDEGMHCSNQLMTRQFVGR